MADDPFTVSYNSSSSSSESKTTDGQDFSDSEKEEVFNRGNKNEIGLHTNRKCAKQHGLIRFNTPGDEYYCDLCKQVVPKDTVMYGCEKCGYDICTSCETS